MKTYLTIAGVWTAVYLGLVIAGQRFSAAFAHGGWQIAPYEVLAARPIRTSLQMHVQPPGWNLVIGVIAGWSPFPDGISFQLLMFAIGLGVALLAGRICLLSGMGHRAAAVVGLAIGLLPNTLHNVFSLAYELPTALLLLLIVNLVVAADARLSQKVLIGSMVVLTTLGLVRSLYHPLWLAVVGVALIVMARSSTRRRQLALIALVPVLTIGALVVKNEIMVGSTSLASWEGMNLLRSVQGAIPQHDLDRMVSEHEVSRIASIPTFSPYAAYADLMPPCVGDGSNALEMEVLSEEAESPFNGDPVLIPNFNFRCFVPVYQQAGADARTLIVEFPGRWAQARVAAARTWFTDYPGPQSPTGTWMRLAGNLTISAPVPDLSEWSQPGYVLLVGRPLSVLTLLATTALLLFLFAALVRWRRERQLDRSGLLVLLSSFVYFSTFAIAVLFELGEQARFRWGVEPILYLAVAVASVTALNRRRAID